MLGWWDVLQSGPKKPVICRVIIPLLGVKKKNSYPFIRQFIGVISPFITIGSGPTLWDV